MIIHTETGSVYEIEGQSVRRTGTHGMRRDEEWVELVAIPTPVVGQSLVMVLEPLGDGDVTVRRTSLVTEISND